MRKADEILREDAWLCFWFGAFIGFLAGGLVVSVLVLWWVQ